MLVTRAMAEDAHILLYETYGTFNPTRLDSITEESVGFQYRYASKFTHPDRGGTAEAFARVDRAKHVLLAWLAKPKPATVEHRKRPCEACTGSGHVYASSGRPGSKGLRRQCVKCRGSGDLDLDTRGE